MSVEKLWNKDFRKRYESLPKNRKYETVSALREIIREMHDAGFPAKTIGRFMGKDHTTVLHHLWCMGIDYREQKRVDRVNLLRIKLKNQKIREKDRAELEKLRKKQAEMSVQASIRWENTRKKVAGDKQRAQELYKEGVPLSQIALELGRSVESTHYLVRIAPDFRKIQRKPVRGVKQVCLDGKVVAVYPTISSASAATNIDRSTISRCVSGIDATAGGYKWERAKV